MMDPMPVLIRIIVATASFLTSVVLLCLALSCVDKPSGVVYALIFIGVVIAGKETKNG